MTVISITIPDEQMTRVAVAVANNYGYEEMIPDGLGGEISNPETRRQFFRRMLRGWVKENVKSYEAKRDSDIAREAALIAADEINIT